MNDTLTLSPLTDTSATVWVGDVFVGTAVQRDLRIGVGVVLVTPVGDTHRFAGPLTDSNLASQGVKGLAR